jgi:hypothetical protein
MKRRPSSQRGGTALPAALATLAVSAAFTAAVTDVVRTELALARLRRATSVALAAADRCLAEVVAALSAGWDFAGEIAGGDGVSGTADDGFLASPTGCNASAGRAPGAGGPERALLSIEAHAGGGRRTLKAVVARDPRPGVAALLWLGAPPGDTTIAGTLVLDGSAAPDSVSALAAPADPLALDAWVMAQGPHLVATTPTGAPITGPGPPLAALATRLRAVAGGPSGLRPPLGDTWVNQPGSGAGLLVVEGLLDIQSTFAFTGVVVASGVRVRAGASLAITGALWLGAGSGDQPPLGVDGVLRITHSQAAIDAVDQSFTLPRRAHLLGMRDSS